MHQVARSKKSEHRLVLNPENYGLKNCQYLNEHDILPPEIKDRYNQLVEQICEISKPWFDTVPLQRVHGDCHLGNIL